MASVRFSGPNNSTFFTTCCGMAITDYEKKCPKCGEGVPGNHRQRWITAMRTLPRQPGRLMG
jgi:ribosomal protein S27AE